MAGHKDSSTNEPTETIHQEPAASRPKCGIIMPIAGFGTYTEGHWNDVLRIIVKAADLAGFDGSMVSTGADLGVIHANIINNIYSNEIVVCDVSGKNANVMFELGLRLASKLPVIIIKDELTGYSFDTSPIEHLSYRSDLRLYETLDFQEKLRRRLTDTYEMSRKPNYKTFLDHFGSYALSKVEDKTIDLSQFIGQVLSRLDSIEQRQISINQPTTRTISRQAVEIVNEEAIAEFQQLIQSQVDDLLGNRGLYNVADYEQALSDVKKLINYAFTNHTLVLPINVVDKAIKNAITDYAQRRPSSQRSTGNARHQ